MNERYMAAAIAAPQARTAGAQLTLTDLLNQTGANITRANEILSTILGVLDPSPSGKAPETAVGGLMGIASANRNAASEVLDSLERLASIIGR